MRPSRHEAAAPAPAGSIRRLDQAVGAVHARAHGAIPRWDAKGRAGGVTPDRDRRIDAAPRRGDRAVELHWTLRTARRAFVRGATRHRAPRSRSDHGIRARSSGISQTRKTAAMFDLCERAALARRVGVRSEVSSLLEPRALALSVVPDWQGLFAFRNSTVCELLPARPRWAIGQPRSRSDVWPWWRSCAVLSAGRAWPDCGVSSCGGSPKDASIGRRRRRRRSGRPG